jgi:hypothetical protein
MLASAMIDNNMSAKEDRSEFNAWKATIIQKVKEVVEFYNISPWYDALNVIRNGSIIIDEDIAAAEKIIDHERLEWSGRNSKSVALNQLKLIWVASKFRCYHLLVNRIFCTVSYNSTINNSMHVQMPRESCSWSSFSANLQQDAKFNKQKT